MRTICSWRRRKWPAPTAKALRALAATAAELAGANLGDDDLLAVNFVGPRAMRRINRAFLGHDRVTDVIVFDYRRDRPPPAPDEVAVEIIICPDLALARSREVRSRDYPGELTLYLVHGLLHAADHDDHSPAQRHRMRHAERRAMAALRRRFPLAQIIPAPPATARPTAP